MDFDRAVKIVIALEGGYVVHPKSAGGETNFGISKASYPHVDIANLTESKAREIYLEDFWRSLRCDELPADVRLLVFDAAVNQGRESAIRMLQKSLGVKQDGIVGPQTMAAFNKINTDAFSIRFLTCRAMSYTRLKSFRQFGEGWFSRLFFIAVVNDKDKSSSNLPVV